MASGTVRQGGICVLFIFGLLGIAGCGDSSTLSPTVLAPPPPPAPLSPGGLYIGQFTSTVTGLPVGRQVVGVVSEELNAHFFGGGGSSTFAGTVATGDGNALRGTLTEYLGSVSAFFGTRGIRTLELDGTLDATGLFGDYAATDDEGRFNLNHFADYERPSSLDLPAGVWSFNLASAGGAVYIVTLTIDDDGQVFGSDTAGCVFNGQLSIIDSQYNAYRITINISSCREFDGGYTGLAFLHNSQRLGFSVANANFAFATNFEQ